MPRGNRLPHLPGYIRYAVSWKRRRWHLDLSPAKVAVGAIIGAAVIYAAYASAGMPDIPLGLAAGISVFALYMIGAFRASLARGDRSTDSQVRLRREALGIAERLEQMLDARRLERDLSTSVAALLDEAAGSWHRVRTALMSPYWVRAELPKNLRLVRDQSLLAIDEGMQELLVLLATSIPERPNRWSLSELVDEAIGQDFLTTRGRLGHPSPFLDEAHSVAGKLRELADQVDEASRRLVGEQLVEGATRPGAALEATLAELRQIKEAEEELRRDVQGRQ